MKKILSLALAISLCLSAVILLASCTGKSAYEVAVENGFVGTETEWLESLKGKAGEAGDPGKAGDAGTDGYPGLPGKPGLSPFELLQFNENYQKTVEEWLASLKGSDAKDGHTPVVTVDTNGYWVIDGTRQPVKVDGSKAAVTSIELAQSVFTVVKSGNAPTLQIKVKLDDGSEDVLPVSNSVIADASYDLTKEGVYPVTINYGGKTTEATVTVEGLMIYFENFDALSDSATMADICAETGIKIPAIALDSPRTGTPEDGSTNGEAVLIAPTKTWYDDGSDVTPYLARGEYYAANFPGFKIVDGKLYYRAERSNGLYTVHNSMLLFTTDKEMNYAATDTYTVQMDILVSPKSDNGTPDDTSDDSAAAVASSATGNVLLFVKHYDAGATDSNQNRPNAIGPGLGAEYLMANVCFYNGNWYGGKTKLTSADALSAFEESTHSQNVLQTLFPESETGTWHGEMITVRIVVSPRTAENPGYVVYMKKATDGEDKFVKVGELNATNVSEAMFKTFMDETSDGFGIFTRSAVRNDGAYMLIDNVAAWTGDCAMPTNTYTGTYEDLNTAYNASLTPAA